MLYLKGGDCILGEGVFWSTGGQHCLVGYYILVNITKKGTYNKSLCPMTPGKDIFFNCMALLMCSALEFECRFGCGR